MPELSSLSQGSLPHCSSAAAVLRPGLPPVHGEGDEVLPGQQVAHPENGGDGTEAAGGSRHLPGPGRRPRRPAAAARLRFLPAVPLQLPPARRGPGEGGPAASKPVRRSTRPLIRSVSETLFGSVAGVRGERGEPGEV